jgi:hypothetical protein
LDSISIANIFQSKFSNSSSGIAILELRSTKKQNPFTAYFAIVICNTVKALFELNGRWLLRLLLCGILLKIKLNLLETGALPSTLILTSKDQITLKPSVIFF